MRVNEYVGILGAKQRDDVLVRATGKVLNAHAFPILSNQPVALHVKVHGCRVGYLASTVTLVIENETHDDAKEDSGDLSHGFGRALPERFLLLFHGWYGF